MIWIEVEQKLNHGLAVLLDGALGTELQRRDVNTDRPSWTANALLTHPELIVQIHREYVDAGAEIITANTFRTHRRSLVAEGLANRAEELTRTAITLARDAADGRAIVAGSLAPLEDCYRPDLTPILDEMKIEHQWQAEILANAGVDLILVETQNSLEEAVIATDAATRTGLPFFVSFVVNENCQLLSGETLTDAVQSILKFKPKAILTNCCPVTSVEKTQYQLHNCQLNIPIGAYPNTGIMKADGTWVESELTAPEVFAEHAKRWQKQGTQIIGGCCGTTPAHIASTRKALLH